MNIYICIMKNQLEDKNFMEISNLRFNKDTLLNNDVKIRTILKLWEQEPNKNNIDYIYYFDDGSWAFVETD